MHHIDPPISVRIESLFLIAFSAPGYCRYVHRKHPLKTDGEGYDGLEQKRCTWYIVSLCLNAPSGQIERIVAYNASSFLSAYAACAVQCQVISQAIQKDRSVWPKKGRLRFSQN